MFFDYVIFIRTFFLELFCKYLIILPTLQLVYLSLLTHPPLPTAQVCFSADSRMLISGSKDSTLKLWDLATRKIKEDLPGHADEMWVVWWSFPVLCTPFLLFYYYFLFIFYFY